MAGVIISHTPCLWSIPYRPKRLFRPNTSDGRGRPSWALKNLQHRFRLNLLDRCKKDLEEVEKTWGALLVCYGCPSSSVGPEKTCISQLAG